MYSSLAQALNVIFLIGLFVFEHNLCSIRSTGVLRPLELYFESFHADLEAVHCLNCTLSRVLVVERNEAETFALVGGSAKNRNY